MNEEQGLKGQREVRDAVNAAVSKMIPAIERLAEVISKSSEEQARLQRAYVKATWAMVILTLVIAYQAIAELF